MMVGWMAVNWGGWVGGWIVVSLVGRATVTRAGSRAEGVRLVRWLRNGLAGWL